MTSSTSRGTSCLMRMLSEIVANDQKHQYDGFVNVAPIAFWTQLFAKYFLHINNPQHDDLLFYVKKCPNPHAQPEVQVFRRESTKAPGLGDPAYDWTETVYLNLILQQLEYTLTCGICTKSSSPKQEVTVHKKVSQQVYASPSKHSMDEKGKSAELSFPNMFFTIDSFDEVWNDLILSEDEMVCVEIVATDKAKIFSCVIFLGSVNHSALIKVYNNRTRSTGTWAKVMTLGLLRDTNNVEFVRMKGPNGKGYAEMAIQRFDEATASYSADQCTCLHRGKDGASIQSMQSCSVHSLSSSKSDPSLNRRDKHSSSGLTNGLLQATSNVDVSKHRSGETSFFTATPTQRRNQLKNGNRLTTHLTYVTLPWDKIILDILHSFEKPTSSKRPVLHKRSHSST